MVILGVMSAATFAPQNRGANKVLIFKEIVLFDAVLDSGGEVLADPEVGVQPASIDRLTDSATDAAGCDFDEGQHSSVRGNFGGNNDFR